MSLANGYNRTDSDTVFVLRRCAGNVWSALGLLARPARIRRPRSGLFAPGALLLVGCITVVLFLILMITIDGPAIRAVAHLPRWIIAIFDDITDYGKSGWFLWPLGLVFLGLAALPSVLNTISQHVLAAVMVRVGFLFTAIAVPSLFVTIVKRIIGRARPMVGGTLDPFLYSPFAWKAAYAGMPSGHVTTAFAVLVAFGTLWPRARTALLVYALLIAASRVIVNAHYPTDVIGGALVGVVGAVLVRRYFADRRLGFSIGPRGEIHEYPGPSLKRIKTVARALLAS